MVDFGVGCRCRSEVKVCDLGGSNCTQATQDGAGNHDGRCGADSVHDGPHSNGQEELCQEDHAADDSHVGAQTSHLLFVVCSRCTNGKLTTGGRFQVIQHSFISGYLLSYRFSNKVALCENGQSAVMMGEGCQKRATCEEEDEDA